MNAKPLSLLLSVLTLATAAAGADTAQKPAAPSTAANSTATNSASADTNSAPKEAVIPPSTFEMTPESRDPFFPNSTRLAAVATTSNAAPVFNLSAFTLKALSGPVGKRLAMINNRTLAAGERAEITIATGKILVYCDEVRETSALIHTDNEPQPVEIFLRKGAR